MLTGGLTGVLTGVLTGMLTEVLTGVLTGMLPGGLTGVLTGNITSMHNFLYVLFTTMTLYELLKKNPNRATTEKNIFKKNS